MIGKKVTGLVAKNVFALLFVSLILANADLSELPGVPKYCIQVAKILTPRPLTQ